jgi:hypothetical protein
MASATEKTAAQQAAAEAEEAERLAAEAAAEEPQVEEPEPETVAVDDERLGAGRDEDAQKLAKADAEARRQQNRDRRARAKFNKDRLYQENASLRQQVEQLAQQQSELYQRVTKNDGDTIESRLADVNQKLQTATVIQAKAARSTGATAEQDYIEATQIRDQLLEARQALTQAKNWQAQRAQQMQQAEPQNTTPVEVVRQARAFASENSSWYNPKGTNRESRIANLLSKQLDEEGGDPETPEYWVELRALCAANTTIGHLFEPDADADADAEAEPAARIKPNGGPRMSAGGREQPLKRGEVRVPPELKKNMMEAGQWDDPAVRNRVLKRYQDSLRSQRTQ